MAKPTKLAMSPTCFGIGHLSSNWCLDIAGLFPSRQTSNPTNSIRFGKKKHLQSRRDNHCDLQTMSWQRRYHNVRANVRA